MSKIGILITNTGTPDAPTPKAVRRYLREFLSDKRIVQLSPIIWWPILHGLVLPLRPKRSAKLYERIWTSEGSPMRVIMQKLAQQLQNALNTNKGHEFSVAFGMNYGTPSIPFALNQLAEQKVTEIVVLPLFPQYSYTTTASSLDRVKPNAGAIVSNIAHYYAHRAYIQSLAAHAKAFWQQSGKPYHLLISFHGIPKRYLKKGDPYETHCRETAALLASEIGLPEEQWTLCYQSKFGYDKWLSPSTQVLFQELPKRGIKFIDVICPGFAVDCLETMEEIAITGKEQFYAAGGKALRYIPALNHSDEHVEALKAIITEHLK